MWQDVEVVLRCVISNVVGGREVVVSKLVCGMLWSVKSQLFSVSELMSESRVEPVLGSKW